MKALLAPGCWRSVLAIGVIGLPTALLVLASPRPNGPDVRTSLTAASCVAPASASAPTGQASLVLAGQTSWVRPKQQFVLDLSADGGTGVSGPGGWEVYVEVFDRLLNRSDFDKTLCNLMPTPLLRTFGPIPMSSLAPDPGQPGAVEFPIAVGTTGPKGSRPGSPVNLLNLSACSPDCAGVYPVEVVMERAGSTDVVSELTTHLVLTEPAPGSKPLALAWALPASAPPTISKSGQPSLSPQASANIATLTRALSASANVPLTLAPSPITLSALASSPRVADRRSLARLVTWASQPSHQVLARPYAPVTVASLSAAGLSSSLAIQMSTGEAVTASTLHSQPDTSTWLSSDTLNQAALNDLLGLPGHPVTKVVLSEANLAPLPEQSAPQLTPTQPFALASTSGRLRQAPRANHLEAVTYDAGLAAHLSGGRAGVLSAHQLLADLAMIYYDSPNAIEARGVVLDTPTTWEPDANFLQVALSGLASSPIVTAVTLNQLFTQTPKTVIEPYGGVLVRQLASPPPPVPSLPARSLQAGSQSLRAFASTLGTKPPPVLASLDDILLVAQSNDLSPAERDSDLARIHQLIRAQFASVKLQTDTVTLTSTTAQLPITISSNLAYPVTASLQLTSDKLGFGPQGSSRKVTLAQHQKTVEFEVRARATGKFPVTVSLVSPAGGLTLASSRFAVRSSAISPVAIGLTVVAGLVLAGWWGRSLLRGRRHRNPRLVSSVPVPE